MKKRIIVTIAIIFAVLAALCMWRIFLRPCSKSDPEEKTRNHIQTIAIADTLYIPSGDDCDYYFSPEQYKHDNKPHLSYDEFHSQIEAIYEIRNVSENYIKDMMNSASASLNVLGYVLYLRNVHGDMVFDYVLNSFERDDTLFLIAESQWIFGECRVRNILLWIALGGLDSPKLLQPSTYWAYKAFGLTSKQIAILKARYDENPETNAELDSWINALFDPDTRQNIEEITSRQMAE